MARFLSLCFFALALLVVHAASAHAAIKERNISIPTKAPGKLRGTFYTPEVAGPVPSVLVLHTAGGLSDADRMYARALAEAGFAALIVSYQVGWAAPMNQALAGAVDWLRKQPESRDMPVGVVGFSLGASKALLVAALRPSAVKAVIAYYGTYNVEISPFRDVVRQARQRTGMNMPSPVQTAGQIGGAILLLNGGDDVETDPQQTRQMVAVLEKNKKIYELKAYPGALHLFERETQFHPPGGKTPFGTPTAYDPAAAKDSWQMSLAWLTKYLKEPKADGPRR